METIYYDRSNDIAYREDQSDIANRNKPEFKYKTIRQLAWQYLNSTRKDSNGDFDDFYTGFTGRTITPSFAIDNNRDHVFPGALNAGVSGTVSTIAIKSLSGIPSDGLRTLGTIELTNGSSETENVNYNGYSEASGVYTFTLADANFVPGDQTLTYAYLTDDSARIKEVPITKTTSLNIDQSGKDNGLFIITVSSKKEIFRQLVEGSKEIADCVGELQIHEAGELAEAKEIGVRCLGLVDDDGGIGPAPDQDYWTIDETIDYVNQNLGIRKRAVINIVDPTSPPPTEVEGDRYILDETAGVVDPGWDGASQNDIVEFTGSTWVPFTPEEGWITYVDSVDKDAIFLDDGTPAWDLRPAIITDHNDLNNIQGGAVGDYQHLTTAEKNQIGTNQSNISTNAGNISTNSGDITTLQTTKASKAEAKKYAIIFG